MLLSKNQKALAYLFVVLLLPLTSHAAPSNFRELAGEVLSVINVLVPFVIGLTVIVFIWNIFSAFILNNEDTGSIEKGKQIAIWGIVVMVIMFSVWGILRLLVNTFFG